jgi:ADP-ribose pyrophosphatase YjhB (NUDIX family)
MQSPSFRISGKDVVVARFLVFVRVLLTEHALHYTTGGIAIHPHPGVGRSDPSGEGYPYMAQYAYGERIGRTAQLKLGTSAIILDEAGDNILLTRRTDNGRWCLPGGAMDPGESLEECCIREVWEETGLIVRVVRLLGTYSTPHRVTYYEDGQRWQIVTTNFLAEITGGTLGVSNETTAVGFFSSQEIAAMDLVDPHRERIQDFFAGQGAAFIR